MVSCWVYLCSVDLIGVVSGGVCGLFLYKLFEGLIILGSQMISCWIFVVCVMGLGLTMFICLGCGRKPNELDVWIVFDGVPVWCSVVHWLVWCFVGVPVTLLTWLLASFGVCV